MLINVGAAVSNINIVARGITTFTRDITMGGNAFTEEIQKQLNISYDEAEALKVGGQGESDAVVPQEVERVIQGVADQMGGEIQRSLDFYASTSPDGRDRPGLPLRRDGPHPRPLQGDRGPGRRAGRGPEPLQEHRDRQQAGSTRR